MWEWTLPSENRPMKCSVEPRSRALATISCHACPSNSAPEAIASLTSAAPWLNTWPAPRALWPTSELPMSASLGMPTALPWASSVVCG